MAISRSNRAALVFVSGMSTILLTQLVGFVVTPLTLAYLGEDRVGAFRAIAAWFGYVALLDLGIAGAFMGLSNRAICAGERSWRAAFSAVVLAYRKIAGRILLGGIGLCLVIPYLVTVDAELRGELIVACVCLAFNASVVILTPFRLALDVQQRGYIANLASSINAGTVPVCTLLLMWAGAGISSFSLALLVGSLTQWSILLAYHWRVSQDLVAMFFRPVADPTAAADLKTLARPALLNRFSGQIGLHNETILVGLILSPASIVPLFITQRLVGLVAAPIRSISDSTWPGMAELFHSGNFDGVKNRFLDLCTLTFVVAVATLVPIIGYNHAFISLWVGAEYNAGAWIVGLSAINLALFALVSQIGWLFNGAGKIGLMAPIGFYSAIVNLIVSLIATFCLGLIGPLFGNLFGLGVFHCSMSCLLLNREFGIRPSEIGSVAVRPMVMAIVFGPIIFFAARSHQLNWLTIAVELSLWGGVMGLVGWFWALSESQRAIFLRATKLTHLYRRIGAVWGRWPLVNPDLSAIRSSE